MPDIIDTDPTLFERLRPRLQAISLRIVGSAAEAEDVVQDCGFKWRVAEQAALAAPAASRNEPMLAAKPVHRVDTSGRTNCIVSYTAMPA